MHVQNPQLIKVALPVCRRLAQHRSGLFYTPDDFPDPDAEVDAQFQALAAACHADVKPVQVEVAMGRHLAVPAASASPALPFACRAGLIQACDMQIHIADELYCLMAKLK